MIKFQQSQALTSHFESFWSIVNYLRTSASKVVSAPTVLKGGTWGMTVDLSLGIAITRIPVKKFINSGENFLDKLKLSVKVEATKIPEARLFLVNGLAVLKMCDIHCKAGVDTGCL